MAIFHHTSVTIVSQAYNRLSDVGIDSFEDETDRARFARDNYPQVRQYLLSMYPWQFCNANCVQLSRDTVSPSGVWTYQFDLPPDRMTDDMRAIYDSNANNVRPLRGGFSIKDGRVYSDCPALFADYVADRDESAWPPYFAELVITYFEWTAALFITEQESIRDGIRMRLFGSAGRPEEGLIEKTKAIDGMVMPVEVIEDAPFIEARFQG